MSPSHTTSLQQAELSAMMQSCFLSVLESCFFVDRREAGHHAVDFGSLALVDVGDVELVIDIVLGALV